MPIHLPPLSRRRFIAGSAAAVGVGLLPNEFLLADEAAKKVNPNRFALLSDTHIDADAAREARGIKMAEHLRQVLAEVAKLDEAPAGLMINGDFAYNVGLAGDYATAVELLKPIRAAGVPVHIALGNHDDRAVFWAGVDGTHKPDAAMKDKHVALIDTPRSRWLLLDSLDQPKQVRGALGADQLKWLADTLDADAKKPALVMVHHNPELTDEAREKKGGLADTDALLEVLSPRKQAKVLFFGHSHRWAHAELEDGLHLVNLPATAYVFAPEQPSGWVDARIGKSGATLELHCLTSDHPWNKQVLPLRWRKG